MGEFSNQPSFYSKKEQDSWATIKMVSQMEPFG